MSEELVTFAIKLIKALYQCDAQIDQEWSISSEDDHADDNVRERLEELSSLTGQSIDILRSRVF